MMAARSAADRRVHDWFLSRGLPLVLRRRIRVRNLIERAAPVIAGFGAVLVGHDIAVWLTDRPVGVGFPAGAAAVGAALGISALGLPALRRLGGRVWHGAAWAVIGLFVVALPLVAADEGWKVAGIPQAIAVAAAFVGLTYLGVGSIVLWALKFAAIQVGAMVTLMSRALPLLMLTVMIFFTNEIWQLMAAMSGDRFWWTTGFLAAVAVAFMVATIRDEVRALRDSRSAQHDSVAMLAGTPLATVTEPARTPLSRGELVNAVAVMVMAQAIQAVLFTLGLLVFFLALSAIAVPDALTVAWSGESVCPSGGEPPCGATLFDVPVGIPRTSLYTAAFVAVLSGLYFTVSSSTDPMYRQRFFDPLIADIAVSLAGRDVYREREAAHG